MRPPEMAVMDEAARLAELVPPSVLLRLAEEISRTASHDNTDPARVTDCVPQAQFRAWTSRFVAAWVQHISAVPAEAAAAALRTAALCAERQHAKESVQLVWTGPDTSGVPMRHTEQAVLEIIEDAKERLLVVSYAVYNIPKICEALVDAAGRGCKIRLVIESPEPAEGRQAYDALRALGPTVAKLSEVYVWPSAVRLTDANGRTGLMHVKAVVGDGQKLFVSSANLTEYAFTTNMELGVLVTGGVLPRQVQEHVDSLIETRVLVPVIET